MTQETDDATLITAIAAGDRAAFKTLMQTYLPRAYRTAFRLLADAAEAEDVAQEALLRVWRHARNFDPRRASLSTWLYQIVTNLALDRLRRRTRIGQHQPLDHAAEIADVAPLVESAMIAAAERRQVAAALAALPDRARAAIVLVHYEDLSGKAVAAILGITPKALESLLYRALKTLRQTLLETNPARNLH
jgi:RNA polymerase sigma-70 factor (ECF subfamily)